MLPTGGVSLEEKIPGVTPAPGKLRLAPRFFVALFWGALLCPLYFSLKNHDWEVAATLVWIVPAMIALWIAMCAGWTGATAADKLYKKLGKQVLAPWPLEDCCCPKCGKRERTSYTVRYTCVGCGTTLRQDVVMLTLVGESVEKDNVVKLPGGHTRVVVIEEKADTLVVAATVRRPE